MKKAISLIFIFYTFLNVFIINTFGAEDIYIIPYATLNIDGKFDKDLDKKSAKFQLSTICIEGSIVEPEYYTYLCYDARNIYFASKAKDDFVSCKDDATRDFKDSDYVRFYICLDDSFKGRQTLDSKTDWAIIFTPQDTDDNWKLMVR